jgi:ribonuclease R
MSKVKDRILGLVNRPDYRPMTLKEMSRHFEVDAEDYQAFRKAVKALLNEARIDLSRDRRIQTAGAGESEKGSVLGTFRRHARGFGFVRPKNAPDRNQDIFIPAKYTKTASSGDLVAVRVLKSGTRGSNVEGRIVRVVERVSGVFVGSYFEEDGAGYVRVDGTTFHAPIYVGDPGAKGARPGDKVVLEMVRYPSPELEGEGVLVEVLGPRGQPGVDTLSVIRAFGLPEGFDDLVLEEAREQARMFKEDELDVRLDLRDQLTVTIDPATARDFDDAITLSCDERGYWTLGVHIADVSHFVRPGTALDDEARKRGNSVYLPDRVIPMLPEVISNSLASLQQGHTRFTMSAILEFNSEGVRTDSRFARTAIRVDRRFSYEQAFEVMREPEKEHEGIEPNIRALLTRMLEFARILRKRRFQRGALELNMPKVEVELGNEGEVVGAHLASDDESHQVIEEFMLAANEAVAEQLTSRGVAFLRRTHADPEAKKLRDFAEFARGLGFPIEESQSRFELQRVLSESADKPERHAVHYALLRSLKQAIYSPEHEGHYALASADYCHFTSPIRRYPDLQVHRQLVSILSGKKPKSDADELAALAEHCTKTERRADLAERELVKIKLLTYLVDRIGTKYRGVIIGVEDFGLFAQLVEFPIDGLIHISSLHADYYDLDRESHTLVGRRRGSRFRLGDQVEVRIARVDVDRRELDLVLASDAPEESIEAEHLPVSRTAGRVSSRSVRAITPPPAIAARKPGKRASAKQSKGQKGSKGGRKRRGG